MSYGASGWDFGDASLRSEVWLAHEALKPMCDSLSAHMVRVLSLCLSFDPNIIGVGIEDCVAM